MGEDKILEVKCSYKQFKTKKAFSELASDPKFCLGRNSEGYLSLKTGHEYYHQIQGNLQATQRNSGHFFIWSPAEYFLQKIDKDLDWVKNLNVLESFYFNQFLPTIITEIKSS